ncbi:MAG: hypothetical protein Q8L78_07910 [Coxiellaceae bacterium]|nr:hypothetical protein [Coxiellaceae bacterium]
MSNLLKLSVVGMTCLFFGFSSMSALAASSSPNTSVVNSGFAAPNVDEHNADDEGDGGSDVRGTVPHATTPTTAPTTSTPTSNH